MRDADKTRVPSLNADSRVREGRARLEVAPFLHPGFKLSSHILSCIPHSSSAACIRPNLTTHVSTLSFYGVNGCVHRGIPISSGAASFFVLPYAARACAILSER
jgi:hypothetical protein